MPAWPARFWVGLRICPTGPVLFAKSIQDIEDFGVFWCESGGFLQVDSGFGSLVHFQEQPPEVHVGSGESGLATYGLSKRVESLNASTQVIKTLSLVAMGAGKPGLPLECFAIVSDGSIESSLQAQRVSQSVVCAHRIGSQPQGVEKDWLGFGTAALPDEHHPQGDSDFGRIGMLVACASQ